MKLGCGPNKSQQKRGRKGKTQKVNCANKRNRRVFGHEKSREQLKKKKHANNSSGGAYKKVPMNVPHRRNSGRKEKGSDKGNEP